MTTPYHKTNSTTLNVLLASFQENGHTAWFEPQAYKLAAHFMTIQTASLYHVSKQHCVNVMCSNCKKKRRTMMNTDGELLTQITNHELEKFKHSYLIQFFILYLLHSYCSYFSFFQCRDPTHFHHRLAGLSRATRFTLCFQHQLSVV